MTENAKHRWIRIDDCIATVPISVNKCLVIMKIQGDKILTCFCDDANPMYGYNPRWTTLRYYKPTDHFACFVQRDGAKFDLTYILH